MKPRIRDIPAIRPKRSGGRPASSGLRFPSVWTKENYIVRWSVKTRIYIWVLALVTTSFTTPLVAQQVSSRSLSLDEALDIARENNPGFLQSKNDEALSDWDVRQAYGALLPSASAGSGVSWQGPGEQQFGSLTLGDLGFANQPSYYFSNYNIGLSYALDWRTLKGPAQAKAQRGVTLAQIDLAESTLVSNVTNAYVEILRQQEALRLAEQQLENSQFNLRLAQGQLEVGSVTPIDVGQAEVQVGRSEVLVLRTRNLLATSKMRLLQQLGLRVDEDVELSTEFTLSEPILNLENLTEMSLNRNPTLRARRRSKEVADIGISSARSSYFPSISISTGWSGFTREASSMDFQLAQARAQVASSVAQCVQTNNLYSRLADPLPPFDCSRFAFTDEQRQGIINGNEAFPFNFQGSPPNVSLRLQIPIFQGLSRERNLQAARIQRDDLVQQVREQELALEADLSIGIANVQTAYESALLEERNRELADQQLRLARERYQLGAITFVELVDAQTLLAQAERDRIAAVFAYHDAVTGLEVLVGISLRN
ncbi:MAG TPA: TolC family protein [Gemmatimonadetes bacterium]|nr:TolC family protein [Gemmatimonadota bacterium]HIB09726.1 TolC family protein [Gemmatimonadota bacterium]HIC14197.1 TolC family protein [Gemmatimonadota bacterium]HIN79024.1 TolC family protein [Gemmatimonadota bacterium]